MYTEQVVAYKGLESSHDRLASLDLFAKLCARDALALSVAAANQGNSALLTDHPSCAMRNPLWVSYDVATLPRQGNVVQTIASENIRRKSRLTIAAPSGLRGSPIPSE